MKSHLGMLETLRRRARSGARRGVILLLSTAMLIVMFGFAACAVDLGYIVLTAQQLQNAADSACLAAVLELKSADPLLSREQIKEKALLAARKAGILNTAAHRAVQIYPEDLEFGHRSYDFDANAFSTAWEGSEASGATALNAVRVDLDFRNPMNGGPAPAGREALQMLFAPVIGVRQTGVRGGANSHLTPRDLVFVIDVSGSMFGGCGGNQSNDAGAMTGLLLGGIYTSTAFTSSSLNSASGAAYARFTNSGSTPNSNVRGYLPAMYPPKYPQRVAVPSLRGNYQALWNLAFDASTPRTTPNIDYNDVSDGGLLQEDPIDCFTTNSGASYGFETGASAFGAPAQAAAFLAQEFSDRNTSTPWTHWKWVAYCDNQYSSNNKNESKNVYYGDAYDGYANPKNLNVPAAMQVNMILSNPVANGSGALPGGSYVDSVPRNRGNAMASGFVVKDVVGGVPVKLDYVAVIGVQSYARFALVNGYIPCVKGQEFYARDADGDDVLDAPPTTSIYYPQPTYMGYYPRTKDVVGFDKALLYSGRTFNGVYPGDVGGAWMSYVRQGTLHGLNAMIEQEAAGGSGAAFNQVGMASFGTMGWMDLELTNNLDDALRVGVSRLTCYPGQPLTSPKGSGRTNWGSGLREAVKSLTTGPRARNYAVKSIVFLSDGAPNFIVNGYSPGSGYKNPEFNPTTQTDDLIEDSSLAPSYGKDWAHEAHDVNGITIHCVGFSIPVGGSADVNLQDVATIGRGLYKNIPGTPAGFAELKSLFVDIAKDRLGQLYSGN